MTRASFLLGALLVLHAASALADDSAAIAALGASGGKTGIARVCLSDEDLHIGKSVLIDLPATTIFRDDGPNTGKKDDFTTWRGDVQKSTSTGILTLKPAKLSLAAPCAELPVKRYIDVLMKDVPQKADDNRLYTIHDILDYPIPAKRPAVEFGKLADDLAVDAVLLTDPEDAVRAPDPGGDMDQNAAACLEGAKGLASYLGRGISGQSDASVFLGQIDGGDVTMGCSKWGAYRPDIYVGWSGSALSPASTLRFIAKSAAYLTGATPEEINSESVACTKAAQAPDAGELSQREFRGVGLECQSFARDGGGGSITVYRRYGAYPNHAPPDAAAKAALEQASAKLKAEEAARSGAGQAFARWWLDPSTPKEAKTFAMMAARALALNDRCPSNKIPLRRIAGWARQLNLDPSDFGPGGKYMPLMTMMVATFSAETQKNTEQQACEAAGKYSE